MTIWTLLVWLISFSMAASVVVLPLPVPPVTKMRPFFSLMISRNIGGQMERFQEGISDWQPAQHHGVIAVLPVDVDAKPAEVSPAT